MGKDDRNKTNKQANKKKEDRCMETTGRTLPSRFFRFFVPPWPRLEVSPYGMVLLLSLSHCPMPVSFCHSPGHRVDASAAGRRPVCCCPACNVPVRIFVGPRRTCTVLRVSSTCVGRPVESRPRCMLYPCMHGIRVGLGREGCGMLCTRLCRRFGRRSPKQTKRASERERERERKENQSTERPTREQETRICWASFRTNVAKR